LLFASTAANRSKAIVLSGLPLCLLQYWALSVMKQVRAPTNEVFIDAIKTTPSLQQRLKDHNADPVIDVIRPGLNLGQYKALLVKFHGFVKPWGQSLRLQIAGSKSLQRLFAHRYKAGWLEEDLQRLGVTPGRANDDGNVPALPELSSVPRLLGSAYVLEGSSLGNKFIAGHVRSCLGPEPLVPCRYFSGYRGNTGAMWRQFLEAMSIMIPGERQQEALDASAQTFSCLSQ
jgi:heme oxygenase